MSTNERRIGFVSTRLIGTDGVSLETEKWVRVLTNMGHRSFCFAGESNWEDDLVYIVEEAHFKHPEIRNLNVDLFDDYRRFPETSKTIEKFKNHLKKHLYKFIERFKLDLLIVENALAIPMNVPLGLAITEVIAETGIQTIAHHHDFSWERVRFSVSAADDYLRAAFPPTLKSIEHVVINSYAKSQLALRTGVSSTMIPNVMDFDSPPPELDEYADDIREALGIEVDEYFLLQPTRIVPRKRIERAIDLISRLDIPVALVISHSSGDEGSEYFYFLQEYIDLLNVKVIFAEEIMDTRRGETGDGRKIYSLADAYMSADLITYPSSLEGFGNAFLETIYYRRPIVMSTYEIYQVDIRPKGFKVIEFGDFITDDTVQEVRRLLLNPEIAVEMSAKNYEIAKDHYSYTKLEKMLVALISVATGEG